jgi:methanogenic corrinoid protein MtbC1
MSCEIIDQLKQNLLGLDFDATLNSAKEIINSAGTGEIDINDAVNAVSDSLQVVGKRFQEGEWFLNELIVAGEIAKEVMAFFSPYMKQDKGLSLGTVLAGTVAGDLHDLGKDIFINHARNAGFNVIDLGVDVKSDTFISAVRKNNPVALGMSCLLTFTEKELGKVIEGLKSAGLRDSVKVIIGGAAITDKLADEIGADAFAPDAISGVDWLISNHFS